MILLFFLLIYFNVHLTPYLALVTYGGVLLKMIVTFKNKVLTMNIYDHRYMYLEKSILIDFYSVYFEFLRT